MFDPDPYRIVSTLSDHGTDGPRKKDRGYPRVVEEKLFSRESVQCTFASVVDVLRLSATLLDDAPPLGRLSLLFLLQFLGGFLTQQQLRVYTRIYNVVRMGFVITGETVWNEISKEIRIGIEYCKIEKYGNISLES